MDYCVLIRNYLFKTFFKHDIRIFYIADFFSNFNQKYWMWVSPLWLSILEIYKGTSRYPQLPLFSEVFEQFVAYFCENVILGVIEGVESHYDIKNDNFILNLFKSSLRNWMKANRWIFYSLIFDEDVKLKKLIMTHAPSVHYNHHLHQNSKLYLKFSLKHTTAKILYNKSWYFFRRT